MKEIKCSSGDCEKPVYYQVKFDDWEYACLFHAAVAESLGCEIRPFKEGWL